MKTAIGFINLHDNPELGKLTERRPLGAVSFLGRYAIIDFALSNFANSDIQKTEILVEKHFDSIRTHIGSGNVWVTNTRTGFLRATINEEELSDPEGNTDIANILENIPSDILSEDYVVVASPQFITSIDYREILKVHGETKAGITVVYTHTRNPKDYKGCSRLIIDTDGSIRKFVRPQKGEEAINVCLESYIFSRDVFKKMVNFSREISNRSTTIRRMVELYANNRMAKVMAYRHKGAVYPILSLNQYIDQSFKFLNNNIRKTLFSPDWPIFTTSHNTPPAYYGPFADVENSFIANGAVIKGKVRNSIICRDVFIDDDADISDCILFTKTEIGKGVRTRYVITDKNVVVKDVKNLVGDEEDYLLISKGAEI
ncbi:MAG: glucose-1-phosphate adenylyltransferase subunit GlgD [Bacilli bacterium]|nr:glucose-1-phosphate adenylyltransferase subunit GlgD [Bacilli bacterium]